ncbi:uncharacterized protein A4U43_C05F15460 [Asparagus officinalis]|uniref:Uncharacterized protein n=1 Tax=Asparagus officinalis TaxID=4686 RepID=A0A5P1EX67_ASPOF|nr:uncharacterized protein A4U43_C05F15460 [Asparagus officinalis]
MGSRWNSRLLSMGQALERSQERAVGRLEEIHTGDIRLERENSMVVVEFVVGFKGFRHCRRSHVGLEGFVVKYYSFHVNSDRKRGIIGCLARRCPNSSKADWRSDAGNTRSDSESSMEIVIRIRSRIQRIVESVEEASGIGGLYEVLFR